MSWNNMFTQLSIRQLLRTPTKTTLTSRSLRRSATHILKGDKSEKEDTPRENHVCTEDTNHDVDFFGILRGEGVIEINCDKSDKTTTSSQSTVLSELLSKAKLQSEDKLFITNFGKIRYDNDNLPKYHGEFDQFNQKRGKQPEGEQDPSNFVGNDWDATFAGKDSVDDEVSEPQLIQEQLPKESGTNASSEAHLTTNFIDEQYFGDTPNLNSSMPGGHVLESNDIEIPAINPARKLQIDNESNVFDEQYFGTLFNEDEVKDVHSIDQHATEHEISNETKTHEPITRYESRRMNYKPPDTENPKTAYDYVMKMRQESDSNTLRTKSGKFKVDSKGFRIYDGQVENVGMLPKDIVVKILKDSVLYDQNDIIALYKPYGLPVQGSSSQASTTSLVDVLPDLANIFARRAKQPIEKLYTVHRLDRDTTGILLLAKTQKMANILNSLFKSGQIHKTYLGITRNVPDIKEGIIDIPIAEGSIEGKKRMVLRPHFGGDSRFIKTKSNVKCWSATTNYKVISWCQNAALMSYQTNSGIKHQIRVHSGFGLSCPILGDHKYSYIDRLVPQKLPGDMLDKLKVRQSKVRHIPMHLHARSLVIPEIANGNNLFLKARLPPHFMQNMTQLKLTLKGLNK